MNVINTVMENDTGTAYSFTANNVTVLVTSQGALLGSTVSNNNSDDGVSSLDNNDQLDNSGMISGLTGVLFNGYYDQIVNSASGTITGGDIAIFIGSLGSVVNGGSIFSYNDTIETSSNTSLIENSGSIASTGGYAIASYGLNQLVNTGDITTNSDAIHGPVTNIDNHGLIEGVNAINGRVNVLTNYGTLDGNVLLTDTNTPSTVSSIHNYGTIQGNISANVEGLNFDGLGGTVNGNITGGTGNDTFDLSHQTVTGTITGGGGFDTIAFGSASAGFSIDLSQGTASGAGEAFNFSGIENATGSGFADTIVGDDGNNVIYGGAGDDIIDGGSGTDTISAGPGADTVMGGPGSDFIYGNGGADILYGNGGADVIIGGAGGDQLWGGAGNDVFIYGLASDSTTAAPDRINDFTHGSDKISLAALNLASASDVTITTGGGLTLVNIDSNNDGTFDMLIQVVGTVTMSDITGIPTAASSAHVANAVAVTADHDLNASLHAVAIDHGLYG